MDEVLYYKALVDTLKREIVYLKKDIKKLEAEVEDAKESVADNLSYYFDKIAEAVSDAQLEIKEFMS